jgi:ATP-binding cassette, subfamily B (MDR/TAP), member 1
MKAVDFFFAAGETTFVVGKSGSGKSTIGQILAKFYSIQQGVVTIDDNYIQRIDDKWVRENILLVEQQSILFSGTIQDNIAMGRFDVSKDLTDQEFQLVVQASEFAKIRSAIEELPQKFKTEVGSKGTSLSGGQRQRVALARAWLKNPPILILDESTSALDYTNRTAVIESIREWRKGKTTIVITHDISQILPHDFVYVMKYGAVVQEGYRKSLDTMEGSQFHDFHVVEEENDGIDALESDRQWVKPPPKAPITASLVESSQKKSVTEPLAQSTMDSDLILDDLIDLYVNDSSNHNNLKLSTLFSQGIAPANCPRSIKLPPIAAPFWKVMPSARSSDWMSIYSETSTGGLTDSEDEEYPRSRSLNFPRALGNKAIHNIGHQIRRFSRIHHLGPLDKLLPRKPEEDIEMGPVSKSRKRRKRKRESRVTAASNMRNIIVTIWPRFKVMHRVFLVAAVLATIIFSISTPMSAFVFSKLMATLSTPQNRKQKAMTYSLLVLAISIVDGTALFVSSYLFQCCGQFWVNNIRIESLGLILAQPRQFFDQEQNEASRLAECLDQHAEEMQYILGRFLSYLLIVATMPSVAILWSIVTCWKLTLVLLSCSPFMYAIINTMQRVTGVVDKKCADTAQNAGSVFTETFTSIKTVRSLSLESHFEKKHRKATNAILKAGVQRAIFGGIAFGLSESALSYLTPLLFFYGSILLASYEFTLVDILRVITLLLSSVSNTTMILSAIRQMSVAREAAGRLLRLAVLPSKCHEHEGTVRICGVGDIVLHNVNFSYPTRPDIPVIKSFNLTIPVGQCVALVGLSGSGKSTIAHLLLNLYSTHSETPSLLSPSDLSADITFSGRSIKRIHTPTLRSLISIVTQTPTILPATVADNIAYGLHKSSPLNKRSNIKAAAIAAGIHSFITSLPQGYDTLIGEGGSGLSGGQAQRIAIARAIIRRPNVLIFDEATSALDAESTALIRDTIRKLLEHDRATMQETDVRRGSVSGRLTVIIITHNRDMMKVADWICMLDRGRVVEKGSYEELVRNRGSFASMVRGKAWKEDEREKRRQSVMAMKRASGVVFADGDRYR